MATKVLVLKYMCSYTYLMGSIFMHNKHHRLSIKTHLDIFGLSPSYIVEPPPKCLMWGPKIVSAKIQGHIIARLI